MKVLVVALIVDNNPSWFTYSFVSNEIHV